MSTPPPKCKLGSRVCLGALRRRYQVRRWLCRTFCASAIKSSVHPQHSEFMKHGVS